MTTPILKNQLIKESSEELIILQIEACSVHIELGEILHLDGADFQIISDEYFDSSFVYAAKPVKAKV